MFKDTYIHIQTFSAFFLSLLKIQMHTQLGSYSIYSTLYNCFAVIIKIG